MHSFDTNPFFVQYIPFFLYGTYSLTYKLKRDENGVSQEFDRCHCFAFSFNKCIIKRGRKHNERFKIVPYMSGNTNGSLC